MSPLTRRLSLTRCGLVTRIGAFGLVAVLVMSLLAATPAHAATIGVTTTDDVVSAKDGLVSLREAITSANLARRGTTISLSPEVYELDICGLDEDANANGDLDHTSTQALVLNGNGATIAQTCPDQRVLHFTAAAHVSMSEVTVTGGETVNGAAVAYRGALTLDAATIVDNDATDGGYVVAGIAGLTAPRLYVVDTTVGPNTGTGLSMSNATASITDSVIYQNSGRGAYLVDAGLTVTGSVISQNGAGGLVATAQGDGLVTVTGTWLQNNAGAGISCWACGSLTVTGSTVSGNHATAALSGGGIDVALDQNDADDQPYISIVESTISGNIRDGDGGGLVVRIQDLTNNPPPAQTLITRSTIASNGIAQFSDGRGGGVSVATGDLRIDNSTLTGNYGRGGGGGAYSAGDVYLRHATVFGNFGPFAANLAVGGDLHAFGSIVALGPMGVNECDVDDATVSGGYNVGGDGSCGFSGPGDQDDVGNPQLVSLAANGGPTHTIAPQAASPAVGAVPAAVCTELTTDQRGVSRPQGTDCEAGAVEIG